MFYNPLQVSEMSKADLKLYFAAKQGNATEVKNIIAQNTYLSLDAFYEGPLGVFNNALHEATHSGSLDTVRHLIEAGCTINLPNYLGYTALQIALANQREDMALLLIKLGAVVDSALVFNFTLEYGNPRVLSQLLELNANSPSILSQLLAEAVMHGSMTSLKTVAMHPVIKLVNPHQSFNILSFIVARVNQRCIDKLKLIMDCIRERHGQQELTKELNRASSASGSTSNLFTPINLVCSKFSGFSSAERSDLIRLFVANNVNLNWVRDRNSAKQVMAIMTNSIEIGDHSPLLECIRMGDFGSAKILVLHGAHATPHEALHYGIKANNLGLFKMLVAAEESLECSMPSIHEVRLESKEAMDIYLRWTGQVKSLKHLIRAKWLKQTSDSDHVTKEEAIENNSDLPRRFKEYLLSPQTGDL